MDTANLDNGLYDVKEVEKKEMITYIPDYIFIKNRDFFKKVRFRDILYLEASGSYCVIHLSTAENITCARTLSEIVRHFPVSFFVRVHRSFVVNLEHIERYLGNQLWVEKEVIPIGRQFKKEVLNHLNILGADISLS